MLNQIETTYNLKMPSLSCFPKLTLVDILNVPIFFVLRNTLTWQILSFQCDFSYNCYSFSEWEILESCKMLLQKMYLCTQNERKMNTWVIRYSNMTSFFRFVNKRAIYRLSNYISTCAGACDWLSRRKCTCLLEFGSINCVRHIPQT